MLREIQELLDRANERRFVTTPASSRADRVKARAAAGVAQKLREALEIERTYAEITGADTGHTRADTESPEE